MQVYVFKTEQDVDTYVGQQISTFIQDNDAPVIGFATGSTPLGAYDYLIDSYQSGKTDFSKVRAFNLDEYVGIDRNHEQSYYTFMHENLFNGIDIKEENVHLPYGNTKEDCEAYERSMDNVTVDIQVLGIGSNGHIGFNEPGTSFDEETHIVTLKEGTRKDNARFFENDINKVPTHAITMGIATIMKAKKILLVATGANKADAVSAMVDGPVSVDCPASVLQNHPDVVVIVDKAAASKLK